MRHKKKLSRVTCDTLTLFVFFWHTLCNPPLVIVCKLVLYVSIIEHMEIHLLPARGNSLYNRGQFCKIPCDQTSGHKGYCELSNERYGHYLSHDTPQFQLDQVFSILQPLKVKHFYFLKVENAQNWPTLLSGETQPFNLEAKNTNFFMGRTKLVEK